MCVASAQMTASPQRAQQVPPCPASSQSRGWSARLPLAEMNPFCCMHTFLRREIYGPLTSHCRQTLWGGRQPAIQMCDLGQPHDTPPRSLWRGGAGYIQPQKYNPGPQMGVGFKLNPIWRQRTLTLPIPLGSLEVFLHMALPHHTKPPGPVHTHTRVMQGGWGGGVCALPHQAGALWIIPAWGCGGRSTPAPPPLSP